MHGGTEVAVHASRRGLSKMAANNVVVKLDFQNALRFYPSGKDAAGCALAILLPTSLKPSIHFAYSFLTSPLR